MCDVAVDGLRSWQSRAPRCYGMLGLSSCFRPSGSISRDSKQAHAAMLWGEAVGVRTCVCQRKSARAPRRPLDDTIRVRQRTHTDKGRNKSRTKDAIRVGQRTHTAKARTAHAGGGWCMRKGSEGKGVLAAAAGGGGRGRGQDRQRGEKRQAFGHACCRAFHCTSSKLGAMKSMKSR